MKKSLIFNFVVTLIAVFLLGMQVAFTIMNMHEELRMICSMLCSSLCAISIISMNTHSEKLEKNNGEDD